MAQSPKKEAVHLLNPLPVNTSEEVPKPRPRDVDRRSKATPGETIADYYIGNGGEGIGTPSGELFLRDLYDDNIHRQPYFGSSIDTKLFLSPALTNNLKVNPDLLAKKLTDLNELSPNLGYYVFATIKFYQWIFIDEADMTPVPNDGSTLATYSSRVTIANRFQNTIRIYSPSFKRLSKEHKVALIIHEAVSALVRPFCVRQFECYQRGDVVRNIVATAFTSPTQRSGLGLHYWEETLSIPPLSYRSTCVNFEYAIRGNINGKILELKGADDKKRRAQFFAGICEQAKTFEIPLIELKITGPSMSAQPAGYVVFEQGRAPYENIFLSILDHHPRTSFIGVEYVDGSRWAKDYNHCLDYLEQKSIETFQGDPGLATTFNCQP